MGNRDDKACHGDEQSVAVTTSEFDATKIDLSKYNPL